MKLEGSLADFIEKATPVIVFTNYASLLVGGVWLLIIGQWKFAVFGFGWSLLVPFIISIPLVIVGIISAGVLNLIGKIGSSVIMKLGGFLISFSQHLLYLAWTFLVFIVVLNFSEGQNLIPFILFGYELAVGPFVWMASKETPDNYGTFITTFLMQTAYIILGVFFLVGIYFLAIPTIIILTILFDIFSARILAVVLAQDKEFGTE